MDASGPQRCERAACPRSLSALSLSLPSLADVAAEVVDASCLAFLVRRTFVDKKVEAREVQAEWRRRRRKLKDEFAALLNLSSRSPLQQKRMEELVDMVDAVEPRGLVPPQLLLRPC